MTNGPREAGRRGGRGVLRKKATEKQELVILLAPVGLQSFDGLHKVDDRDGLAGAGCMTQSQDTPRVVR